ncbi:hypothetical protein C8J56DRAFT_1056692 [Mycena floridula]|nr:hypothetical protein C8J56DRAFT_1056692 [Mycena floridula]
MPSKAAKTRAKAQKLRRQQPAQPSGSADNPNNPHVGPSPTIPSSSSFPGTGNVTGSSSAQTGSNDSLAANAGSPDPANVPSGLTIRIPRPTHPPPALPPIIEDNIPQVDVNDHRHLTGRIVIRKGRRASDNSSTLTSQSGKSSRSAQSSHRSNGSDDSMSDTARRLRRADKQPHHGARIPKGLDDVAIQEALYIDARRTGKARIEPNSSPNPSVELWNVISSMSSIIRDELGSRLNQEELTVLEERLSVSGLISAAIDQLHAPRGPDESDEAYNLRQMSLRRLQNPIGYMNSSETLTTSPSVPVVPENSAAEVDPARGVNPQSRIPENPTNNVFNGPPSWRESVPPRYSATPLVAETVVPVPIRQTVERRTRGQARLERSIRLQRLYERAGAGRIYIGPSNMHSDSDDDLNSDEEVERIRTLIGGRNGIPETGARGSEGEQVTNGPGRLMVPSLILIESSERQRRRTGIIAPDDSITRLRNDIARAREEEAAARAANAERLQQERDEILEARTVLTNEHRAFEERVRVTNMAQNRERNERNDIIPSIPPAQDVPRDQEWVSRVALQRTRFHHLREFGESNIADQGVRFDGDGNPYEREHTGTNERDAIAKYFLRNNLGPGRAFSPNGTGPNVNAGHVPHQDRGNGRVNATPGRLPPQDRDIRETPPHLQGNVANVRHGINNSGDDPSGPENDDTDSSEESGSGTATDYESLNLFRIRLVLTMVNQC